VICHGKNITPSKLVERRCGGWLALSHRAEPVKIGVLGETAELATERYRQSLAGWRANIATDANVCP